MIILLINLSGQDTTAVNVSDSNKFMTAEEEYTTRMSVGSDIIVLEEGKDIIKVRMGKNGIRIVNDGGLPSFDFEKYDFPDDDFFSQDDDEDRWRRNRRRFTPHWAGFEIGLNGYLTPEGSTSLPAGMSYMDLNTSRSTNINLNFAQLGLGFGRHIGLVTGLGFEFNKYFFEGNNNITKDEFGVIGPLYPDPGITYDKSRFSSTYLVVPVMLEGQIPVDGRKTLNIAAGWITGAKLGSSSKVVYHENGKQKIKDKNDFSLRVLRYGPTVRLGYGFFQIYGTYYITSLFNQDKGPELYPVQVGVSFTFD